MDRETWNKNLKAFINATQASMKLAVDLANAAIAHFAKHGDVIYLNELMDAIPENYGRRAAFAKWAGAHAPLAIQNGKFVKDRKKAEESDWDNPDGEVKAGQLKAASEKTFWDFAPAPKPTIVDEDYVIGGLLAFVNRARKGDSLTPEAASRLSVIEGIGLSMKAEASAKKEQAKRHAAQAGEDNSAAAAA
jgi:hypothetical protein